MAQVSHANSEFSRADQDAEDKRLGNSGEHQEDEKKTSLLDKVKTKAQVTVRKLKDKVKKSPGDSDRQLGNSGQTQVFDSDDEPASQSPSRSTRSSSNDESKCNDNSREHNTEKPDENMLNSFARSSDSADSPLLAVPTNYSDPQATADVMPPAVIEPKSVSEEGEQSSSNLGEIPEAKEEEQAAVAEGKAGPPETEIGQVERSFEQKDFEGIGGLPKPRGFDINDEGSFKSDDFRTPDDQAATETHGGEGLNAETKGENTVLPEASDGGTVQPRERNVKDGNGKIPLPASTAEFHDSMFSSNYVHDLKPDEPPASEPNPGSEIGITSRGTEETAQPPEKEDYNGTLDNSGTPTAEFHDASNDVKPDESLGGEPNPGSEIGITSRGTEEIAQRPEKEDYNETLDDSGIPTAEFHDASNDVQDLKPDESPAAEFNPGSEIGITSRGTEDTAQPPEKVDYNETLDDSGTPIAEFHDGFQDLNQKQSSAPETNPGSSTGTLSQGIEAKANQSSGTDGNVERPQHPSAAETDLHDYMASSAVAEDLKSSLEKKADVDSGTLTTEGDSSGKGETGNKSEEIRTSTPPETKDVSSKITKDDTRKYDGTSVDITRSVSTATAREADEFQAERYFDALSDEEVLPRQSSLNLDAGRDFNPEATTQYHEQVKILTDAANSRLDAAKSGRHDDTDSPSTGGVAAESSPEASNDSTDGRSSLKVLDNVVQSTSAWPATMWSAINTVASKVSNYGSPSQSSESETQAPLDLETAKLKD